ncbi:MAG TPA: response regulator transcription factor [Bacteroidales bacterium]|nr:response regulator transcription factor [Bacteroidales bacterium]
MIKILIADDHTIVRKGIIQLIEGAQDIKVTAEAKNAAEVLHLITRQDFDVIVLDISMPGRSGLEVLKELKSIKPEIPILILSMFPEEQYAIRVMRSGASGYLTKESAPEELIKALRTIAGGKKYIHPSLAEQLADHFDQSVDKPLTEKLSDREYETMIKIATGKSLTKIAEELSISVKTVSTYRRRILNKLNLNSNVEITQLVIKNNLKTG